MRIGAEVFILLSLFLGQCIGAPPRHVAPKTGYRVKTGYTTQEDEFIVAEVARLANEHKQIYGQSLWQKLAEKHNEKCREDPSGFPQERSVESLRGRFKHVLQYNRPENVRVPKSLLQKLPSQRSPRDNRPRGSNPYNAEERKLIFEELLKPHCKTLHGYLTYEAILGEHDKRRLVDKIPEFQHERTVEGLRSHVFLLKQKGLLPDEIMRKFETEKEGASSSNPPNQQTDIQVANEGQSGEELVDDMIAELLNTSYEIDFSKITP